jgi:hypothetical protein
MEMRNRILRIGYRSGMSSFEIRCGRPEETIDPEDIHVTAVFDARLEMQERDAFRVTIDGWATRAPMNGFGEWEGILEGPFFSGGTGDMMPIVEWVFDGSHGDVDRAFETLFAWLESFNKNLKSSIRFVVVGSWDPDVESIPEFRWDSKSW